jgi:hypothetical protein
VPGWSGFVGPDMGRVFLFVEGASRLEARLPHGYPATRMAGRFWPISKDAWPGLSGAILCPAGHATVNLCNIEYFLGDAEGRGNVSLFSSSLQ